MFCILLHCIIILFYCILLFKIARILIEPLTIRRPLIQHICVCVYKLHIDVSLQGICFGHLQVHSFTGSADDVRSFLDLDFYISINGW